MPENDDDDPYARICQKDEEFSGPPGADERRISYRLTPEERPSGLDVRFVVNVVSGDRAKHIDAAQNKAIMDLLAWCRDYRQQQEQAQQDPAPPGPDQTGREPDARRE
jgi:hypothetical protein